jgi:hypothetical protein
MARELLETPVPEALHGLLEKNGRVRALAASVMLGLKEGLHGLSEQENFSDFHLCESRIDKLWGAIMLAFIRTSGDCDAMKLPQALWPAYYVTRPFRLAAKTLTALGWRSGS